MEAIPKEVFEVNDILKKYTGIHNQFFKSSFLKFIPGLSKPVDYEGHFKNLSALSEHLSRIEATLKEADQFAGPFGDYVHALLTTVDFLGQMSRKLSEKGRSGGYTDQEQKADTEKYNRLAADYRRLANEFNRTMAMY